MKDLSPSLNDSEERINGLRCVTVLIPDSAGQTLGAISLSIPMNRMNNEWFCEEIQNKLLEKAKLLELNLSY